MAEPVGVSLLTLPLCYRHRLFVCRLQRGNYLSSSVGVHGLGCVGTGTPALLLATLLSWNVWHHLRRTSHNTGACTHLDFLCLFRMSPSSAALPKRSRSRLGAARSVWTWRLQPNAITCSTGEHHCDDRASPATIVRTVWIMQLGRPLGGTIGAATHSSCTLRCSPLDPLYVCDSAHHRYSVRSLPHDRCLGG
jgi:hypothetical protein